MPWVIAAVLSVVLSAAAGLIVVRRTHGLKPAPVPARVR